MTTFGVSGSHRLGVQGQRDSEVLRFQKTFQRKGTAKKRLTELKTMAPHRVVRSFDENTISRLFSIGRPPNVNLRDFYQRTTMYYTAARGFLQLNTKDLV
jgi:hypothetical protein